MKVLALGLDPAYLEELRKVTEVVIGEKRASECDLALVSEWWKGETGKLGLPVVILSGQPSTVGSIKAMRRARVIDYLGYDNRPDMIRAILDRVARQWGRVVG